MMIVFVVSSCLRIRGERSGKKEEHEEQPRPEAIYRVRHQDAEVAFEGTNASVESREDHEAH
jgi:hypothetical protein